MGVGSRGCSWRRLLVGISAVLPFAICRCRSTILSFSPCVCVCAARCTLHVARCMHVICAVRQCSNCNKGEVGGWAGFHCRCRFCKQNGGSNLRLCVCRRSVLNRFLFLLARSLPLSLSLSLSIFPSPLSCSAFPSSFLAEIALPLGYVARLTTYPKHK